MTKHSRSGVRQSWDQILPSSPTHYGPSGDRYNLAMLEQDSEIGSLMRVRSEIGSSRGLKQPRDVGQDPGGGTLFSKCSHCISYLALRNKLSAHLMAETTNLYYLVVSLGQQSGHHLTKCLCVKVSHKVAIMMFAGTVIISKFDLVEFRSTILSLLLFWLC